MKKIMKELLFFILFLAVILLMVGSLLYEFVPNQVITGVTKYEQSSGTKKILSQIQTENISDDSAKKKENKKTNTDEKKEDDSSGVVTSYEVASDNVAEYSDSNSNYETGKNYPFYDYTKAIDNNSTEENEAEDNTQLVSSSNVDNNVSNNVESTAGLNPTPTTTITTTANTPNSTNTSTSGIESTNKVNDVNTTTNGATNSTDSNSTKSYTYNSTDKNTTNENKINTENLRDTSDTTKTQK